MPQIITYYEQCRPVGLLLNPPPTPLNVRTLIVYLIDLLSRMLVYLSKYVIHINVILYISDFHIIGNGIFKWMAK